MSTERAPRDRRPPNPPSCLTANSNAMQPALTSHCVSVAQAQAKRAAEAAQIALLISAQVHDVTVDRPPEQPEQDDDWLEAPSLPLITPTTTSQTSTILPSDPDDSEDSDHASTVAKKNSKQKQKCIRKPLGVWLIHQISYSSNNTTILITDTSDAPQTDGNGIYKDVNVMDIDSDTPSNTVPKNKKNPTEDINQFFEAVQHMKGDKCGWRRCKLCAWVIDTLYICSLDNWDSHRSGDGCNKTDQLLVDEHTTLQCHMAAKHKVQDAVFLVVID